MAIAFGPVPSRRLGRSLGINNIPPKHCSYACVYCQVGPTPSPEITPRPFHAPEEIRRQVGERLDAARAQGEAVDWLTFVPDGEPTLDSRLGAAIDALRDLGPPIAVISNASLIWREEVRAALGRADWVSLKVDSTEDAAWRRINRPHAALELGRVLDGMRAFAGTYAGTLVSETMLIEGVNDGEAAIADLGHFLAEVGFARAYLAVPTRPPAVAGVHGPDAAVVMRAHQRLAAMGMALELLTGSEGEDFAHVGDLARELLALTAVHPLRESALMALVEKAGGGLDTVADLLDSGALRRVVHAGEWFYVRGLPRD
ncbi:MAG: radical SAM protein [Thiobacillaceae bacterium]|jgi:wyosine [tRNA(Phe)-imidazoG37] synthetase (radical SAM superfamily)|nr:radical SAM protein [Thiobacillaceae bacterium]